MMRYNQEELVLTRNPYLLPETPNFRHTPFWDFGGRWVEQSDSQDDIMWKKLATGLRVVRGLAKQHENGWSLNRDVKVLERKIYEFIDRCVEPAPTFFNGERTKPIPLTAKDYGLGLGLADYLSFLESRLRDLPGADNRGIRYDITRDLFRMLFSRRLYTYGFELPFNELKEDHVLLGTKYKHRRVMRRLIDIAFVLRGLGLVGKCWRDAGYDRLKFKVLAWLTAIWGIGKLF